MNTFNSRYWSIPPQMTTQHSNTTGVDMAAGVPTDDSSGGGSIISEEAALDR